MSRLRTAAVVAALALPVGAAVPPAQAAGSIPAAVSLTAPASGAYGTAITLQGRLWRYGTAYGISRSRVWLQRSAHGRSSWSSISSATTASNGNYAFRVTQTGAYDYRVYYGGSAAFRAALSPVRYPVTTQRMTFDSIATTSASSGALRATGRVFPVPPNGRLVYLQRWDPEARVWHSIGSGRTGAGRVVATAVQPGSVTWYRLVVPARSGYGTGVSVSRSYAHYVWRGAFARHGVVSSSPGGDFELASPAANPRRDTISTHVVFGGLYLFGIDSSGCRQVATWSRADTAGGPQPVRLASPTNILDADTLQPGGTVTMSAVLNPVQPRLYFDTYNQYAGLAGVTTVMAVLCAN